MKTWRNNPQHTFDSGSRGLSRAGCWSTCGGIRGGPRSGAIENVIICEDGVVLSIRSKYGRPVEMDVSSHTHCIVTRERSLACAHVELALKPVSWVICLFEGNVMVALVTRSLRKLPVLVIHSHLPEKSLKHRQHGHEQPNVKYSRKSVMNMKNVKCSWAWPASWSSQSARCSAQ